MVDALLCLRNDHLHRVCTDRLAMKSVSVSDLNAVAARMLLPLLFQPSSSLVSPLSMDSLDADGGMEYWPPLPVVAQQQLSPFELISRLCPDPRYKFVTIKQTPLVCVPCLVQTHMTDMIVISV